MVSIRRPQHPRAHVGGSGFFSSIKGVASMWITRGILILFIIYQSFKLAGRVLGDAKSSAVENLTSDLGIHNNLAEAGGLRKAFTDHNEAKSDVSAKFLQHDRLSDHLDDHAPLVDGKMGDVESDLLSPSQEEVKGDIESESLQADKNRHNDKHDEKHARKGRRKKGDEDTQKQKDNPDTFLEGDSSNQRLVNKADLTLSSRGDIDIKTQLALSKIGTGPTELGYVVDFVYERQHLEFRQAKEEDASHLLPKDYYAVLERRMAEAMKDDLSAKDFSFQSCEYVKGRQFMHHDICRDVDTVLYVYNSAPFVRYLCGHQLNPGQGVKLEDHCDEAVHLFPNDDPPLSGLGMPPTVIQSKEGNITVDNEQLETVSCDIPCKFEKDLLTSQPDDFYQGAVESYRYLYVYGEPWVILQSAADPYIHADARVERTSFRYDLYYSTTSFKSSIPLSFYSFDKYNYRNRPPIDWKEADDKASYLLDNNCNAFSSSRRQKWYGSVKAVMPMAAYGSCNHNTDLKEKETVKTLEGRIALAKKHRIHLAFESNTEKDYVTPVIWESLLSGAVPAILGASNLEDILPSNSAVLCSNFNHWDKFAATLKEVASNQSLWESYHKWRTDEAALAKFETKMNFTRTSSQCRVCRWAYAKKYGLGWDHGQQVIKAPHLSRSLCIDKSSTLVTKPFREAWKGHFGTTASQSCTSQAFDTTISGTGYKIKRRIDHHDGVIDIYIMSVEREELFDDDIVFQIEVDVNNLEGAYFPNTHTLVPATKNAFVSSSSIQDMKSKVTILANWETEIFSLKQGVLQVIVDRKGLKLAADEFRRVRIIIEEFGECHDKLTEFYPSSFGKRMTMDFVDPIHYFYSNE